jgi:hypothetical protein
MGNNPLSKKSTILLTLVAGIFSFFTLATISILPMNDANAQIRDTCSEIDAGPNNSFCDYDRDISTDYYGDCIDNVNCIADKSFYWQNDRGNTYNGQGERLDIDVNLQQLLHCDNSDFDCKNDLLNYALHDVNVKSFGLSSFARAQVDMDMSQITDAHDQDNYYAENAGAQQFLAEVRNNAKLVADTAGEENVQFEMYQENYRPDDSVNLNTGFGTFPAFQSYDIDARNSAIVNLLDEQGFDLYQLNDECDVDDDNVGQVSQFCINRSDQSVTIDALNTAKVTFDNERSNGGDLSTTTQINGCNAGFDGSLGDLLCENRAITTVNIDAIGSSQVNAKNVIQDNYQSNHCDDPVDSDDTSSTSPNFDGDACDNAVASTLDINTATNGGTGGRVTVNSGVQDAEQTQDCSGAECTTTGELFVQIGSAAAPVTGIVTTSYSQTLDSNIDNCESESICSNAATISYLANALNNDGDSILPTLTSTSDQSVEQTISCYREGANCENDAEIENTVTAREDSKLTANTVQSITQSCVDFYGTICDNEADLTNTISSAGSGRVTVNTDQTIIQSCSGYDLTCTNTDRFTSTGINLGTTGDRSYDVTQFDASQRDRTYSITVNPQATPQVVLNPSGNPNNTVTGYP